jgi:hypothetical protein
MSSRKVFVWEDDPASALGPIEVPAPDVSQPPLPLQITGSQPPPKLYDKGTPEFRYWTAAAGLSRGTTFWGALVPSGISYEPASPLPVNLDEGEDLNAFYSRDTPTGLNFFHGDGGDGNIVFSGESPDILCHELGHAVLDALRPELFDAANLETPAFHESFGDMSAILTALQVPQVRDAILTGTGGHIGHSSDLSRLAEQLGAAIRLQASDAVDPDCLRNAANSFSYLDTETLPTSAPASMLSQEPHSFSRVFTGAFLETLAGMLLTKSSNPSSDDLLDVSKVMGGLLVAAVQAAPVVPEFYSQVAAAMIQADAEQGGTHGPTLKSAFVRRAILAPQSAAAIGFLQSAAVPAPAPAAMSAATIGGRSRQLPLQAIDGAQYGLGNTPLFVHVATQPRRVVALAAGIGSTTVNPPSSDKAARTFVEHLMRLGRVDFGGHGIQGAYIAHPRARKTHKIERLNGGALVLRRKLFYCGFHE